MPKSSGERQWLVISSTWFLKSIWLATPKATCFFAVAGRYDRGAAICSLETAESGGYSDQNLPFQPLVVGNTVEQCFVPLHSSTKLWVSGEIGVCLMEIKQNCSLRPWWSHSNSFVPKHWNLQNELWVIRIIIIINDGIDPVDRLIYDRF